MIDRQQNNIISKLVENLSIIFHYLTHVLEHNFIKTLYTAVETLGVADGEPCFRLVKSLLAGDPAKQWVVITNTNNDRDRETFLYCIEQLALVYMDREIAVDTKE